MKTSKLLAVLVAGMMAFTVSANTINDDRVPIHRPLIEEYTGTWCGWCVRGLVGMELLRDTFGDDFIGVAYHNGDPMQIMTSSGYPNSISGYPSAYIDRTSSVDPYYGFNYSTPAGIISAMQQYAELQAIAGIDVTAQWTSEDKKAISVDVTSYFTTDVSNAKYAIEFMLIADDLHGVGSTWNQANYYNADNSYADDPNLSPWIKKGSSVSGIHFNDVLVGTSKPISGSLPSTIVAYDDYSYNYTFTLSSLPKPALIQDKNNLHVIALVVNTSNKKVVNANRCYISDFEPIIIPGDVNNDGKVSIADVSSLINYLLTNGSSSINEANADYDGDGKITITDVTGIIHYLLTNAH